MTLSTTPDSQQVKVKLTTHKQDTEAILKFGNIECLPLDQLAEKLSSEIVMFEDVNGN
jgi:hypothetical protein